ncbi:peptidase A4 family-domain-containing protein [Mycena rosella]|uniref:Peptidase A4 family-domain-containing protein n=1 Tax=Mycena rosella TaxID=1033263 RepID=A0AAD7D8F3_MYCRO|nr:peptidase A4 family-domain-containing protein [Mycena rosella]
MFFSASLLSYALLASTVFAVPTSRLDGGIARRAVRLVSPFRPADGVSEKLLSARKDGGSGGNSGGGGGNGGNTKTATVAATSISTTATSSPPSSTDSAVLTSSIWAGAGMESPANTYQSVTGTLVVPHLQPATGGASTGFYGGSAWVGLDGMTCQTSLMATGIDFIYFNETITANAWTEVYPNPGVDLSMSVNVGDTIKLTVTATSTTTGTAVVENLSNGQSSTVSLTSPSPLCLENAEWIVEDFQESTFLIPFADFGSITFTDASATTQSGSTVGPSGSGSHIINMVQKDAELQVLQFTSASSAASSVTVEYLTSIPF